ncbi:UMP kinase [Deferribacterales bacterium RsTz2092]|nr:uridylate kinase [Deferribacterales bacterium]
MKYNRILLKLSGEALMGEQQFGIDSNVVRYIADEVATIHSMGAKIGIVIGGGNIYRGVSGAATGMNRVTGDYMGMLATVINALSVQDALERAGVPCRLQTAIQMNQIAEPFIRQRAMRHMEKGRAMIFAAGTGNPYFTTDTAAALRASEIDANVLIKATKVDGVYTADPMKDKTATKYDKINYMDVITQNLSVMDATAITLCMENSVPIVVFSLYNKGDLAKIVSGEDVGTIVTH